MRTVTVQEPRNYGITLIFNCRTCLTRNLFHVTNDGYHPCLFDMLNPGSGLFKAIKGTPSSNTRNASNDRVPYSAWSTTVLSIIQALWDVMQGIVSTSNHHELPYIMSLNIREHIASSQIIRVLILTAAALQVYLRFTVQTTNWLELNLIVYFNDFVYGPNKV